MIVIVDSGVSNVRSVANMLRRGGIVGVEVSRDPARIAAADRIILPGVGAFDAGMRALRELGLRTVLDRRVMEDGIPVLGICLGMQLLAERSEEGVEPGLGWIQGDNVKFSFPDTGSSPKVPHMGWNVLRSERPSPLFDHLDDEARFYFVHSYHLRCRRAEDILATATYGEPFVAAVRRGNVYGVQFHPEKSHRFGMALLQRFASL
jgi:imidazole glycerol-phosphate synthase subunit HisH